MHTKGSNFALAPMVLLQLSHSFPATLSQHAIACWKKPTLSIRGRKNQTWSSKFNVAGPQLFQNVPSMWTVAGPVSRASPFLKMSNIREVDAIQVHAHQILPNRSWEPQSSRLEFVILVLCITLWMDFWGFLEAKVNFKRSTQSYAI